MNGDGTKGLRRSLMALAIATSLTLIACGEDEPNAAPATSTAPSQSAGSVSGTQVAVTLSEFAISASPSSVPAGEVTFTITNSGPDDVHEFVVIRTDLPLTDLPTDVDGAVEEGKGDLEAIDEVEDLAVGATEPLTVDLTTGSYVLVCNIVQTEPDGSIEAHYAEGMRTSFTVT